MKKLILAFLIISLSQNLFSQEWIEDIWEADWLSSFYEKHLDSANDICTVTLTSDSNYLLVVNTYYYDSATDFTYLIDEPIVYKINMQGEIVWRTFCRENNEKSFCIKNDTVDVLYDFIVLYPLTCFYDDSVYQNTNPSFFMEKLVKKDLGEATYFFDKSIYEKDYKINERKVAGFIKGRYNFQTSDKGYSCNIQNKLYYAQRNDYLTEPNMYRYRYIYTLNVDGANNYFGFIPNGFFHPFQIIIYNRWGQKVYENDCSNELWDRKYTPVTPDVHYYVINYELIGGKKASMQGSIDIKIRD